MRKEIARTIVSTVVNSSNVSFVEGNAVITENDPLVFTGVIKEDKMLKEVRKVYGANANITKVETSSKLYEISVEDFMKHATVVEE